MCPFRIILSDPQRGQFIIWLFPFLLSLHYATTTLQHYQHAEASVCFKYPIWGMTLPTKQIPSNEIVQLVLFHSQEVLLCRSSNRFFKSPSYSVSEVHTSGDLIVVAEAPQSCPINEAISGGQKESFYPFWRCFLFWSSLRSCWC